jgi:hypothetical protein
LRKTIGLTRETQDYINRYRVIYRTVIMEAKNRENDRYVLNAKNKSYVADKK